MAAFLQSVRLVLQPETVPIAQGKCVAAGFPYNVRVLKDWQKVLKLSMALILLSHERNESSSNEQGFNVLSIEEEFSITTKLHQCIQKGIGYYRHSLQ